MAKVGYQTAKQKFIMKVARRFIKLTFVDPSPIGGDPL